MIRNIYMTIAIHHGHYISGQYFKFYQEKLKIGAESM